METIEVKMITQSEFIKNYCKNSEIEESKLNEIGLFAVPCNCGEDACENWAMITKENLKEHVWQLLR